MGTTIHAHIEVKKNNTWFHYATPDVNRNYMLFAATNGERLEDFRPSVRDKIIPQASIKGLPDDISDITKICYEYDINGRHVHGEGALTANDIRNLQRHLAKAVDAYKRAGFTEMAQNITVITFDRYGFLNADSICTLMNYMQNSIGYEKMQKLLAMKEKELNNEIITRKEISK